MVKAGIARTRMFILREAKQVQGHFSSYRAAGYDHNHHHNQQQQQQNEQHQESGNLSHEGKMNYNSSCWVPHPRTGIYVPKGHERVMDDVPEGAASFNQTYWLRTVDGVERPDPDVPSDHYLSFNLY
ncbi:conserved hypothetical protein [Ricinus communis]|uniref:Uncharacterized protein n=1 Tax=Ricinus communis TaxID=3988 RepID=B9SNB6_RICCO|nr:conserved hypothetical protein [Ricinus communis]|eukprot:XP_002527485.1 uncharacterized protein LOC8272246 [Ricinus communis]